ncbi:hypothetical protein [Aquimarina sp. MMG016]|uniref:hypothetical protein n=1 Tax=Aquimarina sp. MMG016 TaxID=2822690 RepID=UPI001B3A6348|nr:hypothetical protein [Aquimarina sp. MMG016]MBQ4819098.1 hypothetical protein [Aquimarina sp. MMG016]
MKKLKYIMLLLCFVSTAQLAQAQNEKAKDVLEKVKKSYDDKKQYEIETIYNMHRGLTGNSITESYKGEMVRNEDVTRFRVLKTEILQFPKAQLNIDHNQKKVIYAKTQIGAASQHSPIDVSVFLKLYYETSVTEKNGVLICEMVSNKPVSQNPYGKVVLHINKNTYLIEKQELFFSTLIPFVDEESNTKKMDYGRLVILLQLKDLQNNSKPALSDFITISPDNNISLTEQYKGYTLINQAN